MLGNIHFVILVGILINLPHYLPFIHQIPHLRPAEYKRSRLSRNRRTVNRAYGGVLSGGAVRERCALTVLFTSSIF